MRKNLRERRKQKGYKTQKQFAEALEISIRTLQHVEQGNRFPRELLRNKIMEVLDVSSISILDNFKQTLKRGDVIKNICVAMNELSNKQLIIYQVSAIQSSIIEELKLRKEEHLTIKGHTEKGKEKINRRCAIIANDRLKTDYISHREISLFRRCRREEFETRNNKTSWSIPSVRKNLGFDSKTGYEIK